MKFLISLMLVSGLASSALAQEFLATNEQVAYDLLVNTPDNAFLNSISEGPQLMLLVKDIKAKAESRDDSRVRDFVFSCKKARALASSVRCHYAVPCSLSVQYKEAASSNQMFALCLNQDQSQVTVLLKSDLAQ